MAKPKSAKNWQVEWVDVNALTPYANNARNNEQTVPYLVNSIKRFGFKVPLVIDGDGVIVCGHTRLKAALECGMSEVPCVRANDLSPAEIRAFRLVDNKVQELSAWDLSKLEAEMKELNDIGFDGLGDFGFEEGGVAYDPTEIFDDENAREKKKKHYAFNCPNCNRRIVVEG